ncbi:MAG: polysaccharide biosynthesis/export family protein, partial [Nitrososphaerota archaeon]
NPNITVSLEDFNVKIKELKRSITTAPRGQSKVAPIAPDGKISFPLIGSVHAEGLTLRQLEERVNREYAKQIRNLNTTLVLLEIHHNKFYILGEVERPGVYEIPSRMNLLSAISIANGYKKTANLGDVIVFRNYGLERPIAFKVNLQRALKEGYGFPNVDIYPADIIYVPKSAIDNFNDWMEKVFTKGIYTILPFQSNFTVNYNITK